MITKLKISAESSRSVLMAKVRAAKHKNEREMRKNVRQLNLFHHKLYSQDAEVSPIELNPPFTSLGELLARLLGLTLLFLSLHSK